MKSAPAIIIGIIILLVVGALFFLRTRPVTLTTETTPAPPTQAVAVVVTNPPTTSHPQSRTNHPGTTLAGEFTDAERRTLTNAFTEKFKPALERWFKAYEGRVPFRPEDVTLDKFAERIEGISDLYTFVFNGITLTIQYRDGKANVYYLALRDEIKQLNDLPHGAVPQTELPVTRDQVIQMVEADTSVKFKPNEVLLDPTGIATAMNGGAKVRIGPPKNAPPGVGPYKIDMTFGPDGKLCYYMKDPFF
jgi:hypothetical protein